MALLLSHPRRPAPRRTEIVEELRRRIVNGEIKPGGQLPPRTKLVEHFGTSAMTLQHAVDVLRHEGFIVDEPRHGTFVAENPPHLSRYAIVLGEGSAGLYGSFTAALRRHVAEVEKERSCNFVLYENVTGQPDTVEYRELLRDVRSRRLAGLLLRADACGAALPGTPFMTIPGIPRVFISGDPEQAPRCPGVPTISNDDHALLDHALDYLCERGRRRVALLSGGESSEGDTADFLLRAERRGMTAKGRWVLGPSLKEAPRVTELLLSLPPGERPDGLILITESLIKPVGAGISAIGTEAGRDLDVVAYCHLPCPGPAPFPMRRLGVDMRERLRIALDLLDRQQRGESVPPRVLLSPVFDEELSRSANVT